MSELQSLIWSLEAAHASLRSAMSKASALKLECTELEISKAKSHVESVLFEIERKVEPEFAPFLRPSRQETAGE